MKKILGIIISLAIVVGGAYWFFRLRPASAAGYQAAFLTNGQVYFGKPSGAGPNYVRLDDVYYLVTLQATDSAERRNILRKLGVEIHGPENELLINRKHILYTEPLKNSSKVVEAIKQEKEQGK